MEDEIMFTVGTAASDAVNQASDVATLVVVAGLVGSLLCLIGAVGTWFADSSLRKEAKNALEKAAKGVGTAAETAGNSNTDQKDLVEQQSVAVDGIMEAASKLATSFKGLEFHSQLLMGALVFFGLAVAGAFASSVAAAAS